MTLALNPKPSNASASRRFFYILCILPVEFLTYSVNFLYVLLFLRLKYRKINDPVLAFFAAYVIICYFIGLIFFIPWDPHSLFRQLISFGTFSSGLFLLFIKFDETAFEDLISAAITASALYALWAILMFVTHWSEFSLAEIYGIKMQLREYVWDWPQTYVPLLDFALIVALSRRKVNKLYLPLLGLFPIVIFFTFTRSAYLALFAGLTSYLFFNTLELKSKVKINNFIKIGLLFLSGIIVICALFKHEGIRNAIYEMANRSFYAIYNYITNSVPDIGSDEERTAIMHTAFSTAKDYLLTGTGFGGIYLFTDNIGSTHNQYLDTFLKMGLIGMVCMSYIFLKLLRFFYIKDKGVCSGIIALLVYGLFNAVYQQPYLVFLFFSLLSFVDSQYYYAAINKKHIKQQLIA